jgi:ribosome modulation factor
MKRVKRDPVKRANRSGYKAGLRGHSTSDCPFHTENKRMEWLGGWRGWAFRVSSGIPHGNVRLRLDF